MRKNFPPVRREQNSRISVLILATALGIAGQVIHNAFAPTWNASAKNHRSRQIPTQRPPLRAETPEAAATDHISGKGVDTPIKIPGAGWWAILQRTIAEVNGDRVLAVAGGVTFYSLLSLFPAITVLVSAYGLFANQQGIAQHLQLLSGILPEGAMSIIGDQVKRIATTGHTALGFAAITGLILALWSANSAVKAMMDALNIAYDAEEKRGFIKLNLVSFGFTVSGLIGLVIMFGVVAIIPTVLNLIWLGQFTDALLFWGRWPVSFLLILLAFAVLYRYGPSRPNVRWRWITPGSLLATVGLIIFSILFSWYAANLGKFNETYGSLGAAIGFMTWLWLSATIALVGAELNAEVENQARPGLKPGETQRDVN